MKCDKCFHSYPVVSENGTHYVCTLSSKTATKCLTGENDHFYARRKEKKRMTKADRIRSMNDEELAAFLAESQVVLAELRLKQLGIDFTFSDANKEKIARKTMEAIQQPWEEE